MTPFIIVSIIGVIVSTTMATLLYIRDRRLIKKIYGPNEKAADKKARKAAKAIRLYCKAQTEAGHCAFNLNKDNEECDCLLLKKAPEEWDEDNQGRS